MILNEEIKLSELQYKNFGDNAEIIFDIECFDETGFLWRLWLPFNH